MISSQLILIVPNQIFLRILLYVSRSVFFCYVFSSDEIVRQSWPLKQQMTFRLFENYISSLSLAQHSQTFLCWPKFSCYFILQTVVQVGIQVQKKALNSFKWDLYLYTEYLDDEIIYSLLKLIYPLWIPVWKTLTLGMGEWLRIKHLLTRTESLGNFWSFKDLPSSFPRKKNVCLEYSLMDPPCV